MSEQCVARNHRVYQLHEQRDVKTHGIREVRLVAKSCISLLQLPHDDRLSLSLSQICSLRASQVTRRQANKHNNNTGIGRDARARTRALAEAEAQSDSSREGEATKKKRRESAMQTK